MEFRCLAFDFADETITATGQGLNVPRRLGRIPQRFSQALNGVVDAVVEIDKSIGGPDLLPQMLSCYHFPPAFEQDLKRLLLQTDFDPVLAELSRGLIELEGTETDCLLARTETLHGHTPGRLSAKECSTTLIRDATTQISQFCLPRDLQEQHKRAARDLLAPAHLR